MICEVRLAEVDERLNRMDEGVVEEGGGTVADTPLTDNGVKAKASLFSPGVPRCQPSREEPSASTA